MTSPIRIHTGLCQALPHVSTLGSGVAPLQTPIHRAASRQLVLAAGVGADELEPEADEVEGVEGVDGVDDGAAAVDPPELEPESVPLAPALPDPDSLLDDELLLSLRESLR